MNYDNDRLIYDSELRDFLPSRIFDTHVHLFDSDSIPEDYDLPPKSCYRKFGGAFPIELMEEWAGECLPEQELYLNSFGMPNRFVDRDRAAAYTGEISDNQRYFGMALVSPKDTVDSVRTRVQDNGLIGYKPYLSFVDWKRTDDITIADMLTEEQLALADALGLAITLHIPRPGRLADPVNQRQMREICLRWSNVKFIFAHIGRAYYLSNVVGFLDTVADCPNAYLDTAMVNHEGVLEHTFKVFPRDRIVFGSDAPIALLQGKSVEVNNQYVYLMGEDYEIGTSLYDPTSSLRFTTFYFEQLRGIKLAAQRAKLSVSDVEDLFFGNAHRLFSGIAKQP